MDKARERCKATLPPRPTRKPRFRRQHGRHVPRCGGRFLVASLGSSDNLVWVSALLTAVPTCLWAAAVLPHLPGTAFPVVTGCGGLFLASTLASLVLAHLTEPGLLLAEAACEADVESVRHVVVVGNQRTELAVFRAKFCRETDNCVERFDHFCPWVGNAVGRRNYRHFLSFLLSVCLLDALVLTTSVIRLATAPATNTQYASDDNALDPTAQEIAAAVLCVFGFAVGALVFPLLLFHLWLVSRNQTTNESIKGVFANSPNPHDKGWLRNCASVWCVGVPPSQVIEPALSKADGMDLPDLL